MNREPYVVTNGFEDKKIKLLDENGQFFNEFDIDEAVEKANKSNLNLVCFSDKDQTNLAFCKIIDYGKWKYHSDKSRRKIDKKQQKDTKTIRFSPVISSHDIEHKVKQIKNILDDGDIVIINMAYNQRFERHKEGVNQKISEILSMCREFGKEVSRKEQENQIFITLSKK